MSEMVERVGEDHLQVVEQNLPGNLAFSLGLNCQVFFDSCRFLQLALFQNVPDVQADALLGGLEQLCHLRLTKPDAAVTRLKADDIWKTLLDAALGDG